MAAKARRCSRRLLGAALGAAVASHGWRPYVASEADVVVDIPFVAPTLRPPRSAAGRPWGNTGRPNPDMRTQRAAFGGGRPGPRGPMAEPEWLGSLFFGLIILSFIPGPWQVILSPIIGLINLFYMFKFGIFLLAIAAIFGLQWYFEATTTEGQCPQCGALQRGSKNEPFNCGMCGTELEVKDDQFVRYMKSGQAPQNPFEKIKDMAQEAAEKQVSKAAPASPKSKKKPSEVVDVEVL